MLEQNKQFEVMQLILLPAVMLCDVITEQVSATMQMHSEQGTVTAKPHVLFVCTHWDKFRKLQHMNLIMFVMLHAVTSRNSLYHWNKFGNVYIIVTTTHSLLLSLAQPCFKTVS